MKNRITKLLLVGVLFLFTQTLNAQDWAKFYTGGSSNNYNNDIYRQVSDNQGNIYVIGTMGTYPVTSDGDTLLPQHLDYAPITWNVNNAAQSVLIAKYDPNGNMLWHKAIKNGQQSHNYPNHIQLVGDTSIVVATSMQFGYSNQDYLYYLDTLLNSFPIEYPLHNESAVSITMFITLDLDGNLLENHSLELLSQDSTVTFLYPDGYRNGYFLGINSTPFYIDNEGYIYIYVRRGGVSNTNNYKIRIDVNDTTEVFHQTYTGGVKLFKFAPHFSGMIWQKDVGVGFEQEWCDKVSSSIIFTKGMEIDNIGSIYITGFVQTEHINNDFDDSTCYNYMLIEANNPLHKIKIDASEYQTGFIIKYDNDGNVQWVNQGYNKKLLSDNDFISPGNRCIFNDVKIGGNNDVYVLGLYSFLAASTPGITWDSNLNVFYFDDTIKIRQYTDTAGGGIFFVKYNGQTGQYISHGIVPTTIMTYDYNNYNFFRPTFAVKNNQVFTLFNYNYNVMAPDSIYISTSNQPCVSLIRWKDNGYIIDITNFPTTTVNNKLLNSGVSITDNGDLILTGQFCNNITFGNITLQAGSNTAAYIVKYHDPSFITSFIGGDTLNDTFRLSEVVTNNADTNNQNVTLKGRISVFGNPKPSDLGFVYALDSNSLSIENISATKVNVPITMTTREYSYDISNSSLINNMTYYYKTFVTSAGTTNYGVVKSFSRATSGLEEVNDVSALISVFPNPATNELNIVSPVAIKQIEVLNLLGRVVYEQKVNAASVKVDVSALVKGNYFVKVYTDKEVVVRKILVE